MPGRAIGNEYRVLAATLRETRLKARVTQVQLAQRLGMTQSFISKCDRGTVRLDMVQVRRICLALGVPFQELVRRFEAALRKAKQPSGGKDSVGAKGGLNRGG